MFSYVLYDIINKTLNDACIYKLQPKLEVRPVPELVGHFALWLRGVANVRRT